MRYLSNLPLTEKFHFDELGNGISFHWSNWDKFCSVLFEHTDLEQRKYELFHEIEKRIDELKFETLWQY